MKKLCWRHCATTMLNIFARPLLSLGRLLRDPEEQDAEVLITREPRDLLFMA